MNEFPPKALRRWRCWNSHVSQEEQDSVDLRLLLRKSLKGLQGQIKHTCRVHVISIPHINSHGLELCSLCMADDSNLKNSRPFLLTLIINKLIALIWKIKLSGASFSCQNELGKKKKNGPYLWCGQVEGRFLEEALWIVVLELHESSVCPPHCQEIGPMCYCFRGEGPQFLEWWDLVFQNRSTFSYSSNTHIKSGYRVLCVQWVLLLIIQINR